MGRHPGVSTLAQGASLLELLLLARQLRLVLGRQCDIFQRHDFLLCISRSIFVPLGALAMPRAQPRRTLMDLPQPLDGVNGSSRRAAWLAGRGGSACIGPSLGAWGDAQGAQELAIESTVPVLQVDNLGAQRQRCFEDVCDGVRQGVAVFEYPLRPLVMTFGANPCQDIRRFFNHRRATLHVFDAA
jgi:hypothetical protein